jgi:hypothetical protein
MTAATTTERAELTPGQRQLYGDVVGSGLEITRQNASPVILTLALRSAASARDADVVLERILAEREATQA